MIYLCLLQMLTLNKPLSNHTVIIKIIIAIYFKIMTFIYRHRIKTLAGPEYTYEIINIVFRFVIL